MRQSGIAHRLRVGFGDGAAVAGDQRRCDRRRCRAAILPDLLPDMRGKLAAPAACPARAASKDRGFQNRSRRRQPVEPGRLRKVIAARHRRTLGRGQADLGAELRSCDQRRIVHLHRYVQPRPDRYLVQRIAGRDDQPDPFERGLLLALEHDRFHDRDPWPADRLRADQGRAGPDQHDPGSQHQRQPGRRIAQQCMPVALQPHQRQSCHHAAQADGDQPFSRPRQYEP